MKRLIVVLVLARRRRVGGGRGRDAGPGADEHDPLVGALQADLAYNTGITAEANGLTWQGKQYSADQLPEFLMRLRSAGVTNLGEWLNLHPAVSARFGMVPVGLLHSPEVVTQQAKFAPGAYSGWHSPSRLPDRDGRVGPGRPVRHRLLVGDVHRRSVVLRDRGADVHRQEREQRGRGRAGDLRRPGRHADDRRSGSTGRSPRPAASDPTLDGAASVRRALAAASRPRSSPARAAAAASGPTATRPATSCSLQNVYFPYRRPRRPRAPTLDRAADAVYARGDRVKVALIYATDDLGAIPSLFGEPAEYAHFLGVELGLWYVGPLLVVMPSGLRRLRRRTLDRRRGAGAPVVSVSAGSPDDLARSATAALQRLAAAGALRSPDVRAPLVTAHPATATRGKRATLRFDVFDDSGRSKALVRVYENGSLLATLASPTAFEIGTRSVAVRWPVPTSSAAGSSASASSPPTRPETAAARLRLVPSGQVARIPFHRIAVLGVYERGELDRLRDEWP